MRGRSVATITTNNAGQYTVGLFGPHTLSAMAGVNVFNSYVTPLAGITGVGTDVPMTTEIHYPDSLAAAYASATLTSNVASAALHAMTIVINCNSNLLNVEGTVWLGSLNQRLARGRFATWNAAAASLINRREMVPNSALSVLQKPIKLSTYPVDTIDWAAQRPLLLNTATLAENITMDSLSQLAVVFSPTTAAIEYNVTVYTEWRMNFMDPALASTASQHPAAPMDFWSKVTSAGQATNGFMGKVESAVSGFASAFSAATRVASGIEATPFFGGMAYRLGGK